MNPIWQPDILQNWCNALARGHVAAAPAEGVYGYVADPFNPLALESLLELKRRDPAKGFILLIGSLSQIDLLCPTLADPYCEAIAAHWEGEAPPTTLILPALRHLPDYLTGGQGSVAVRLARPGYMTDYLAAWALAGPGPLVSTSANLAGQSPATRADQLDPAIPALTLPDALSGIPSRIYNPLTEVWLR